MCRSVRVALDDSRPSFDLKDKSLSFPNASVAHVNKVLLTDDEEALVGLLFDQLPAWAVSMELRLVLAGHKKKGSKFSAVIHAFLAGIYSEAAPEWLLKALPQVGALISTSADLVGWQVQTSPSVRSPMPHISPNTLVTPRAHNVSALDSDSRLIVCGQTDVQIQEIMHSLQQSQLKLKGAEEVIKELRRVHTRDSCSNVKLIQAQTKAAETLSETVKLLDPEFAAVSKPLLPRTPVVEKKRKQEEQGASLLPNCAR
jgi:hypothetical protein